MLTNQIPIGFADQTAVVKQRESTGICAQAFRKKFSATIAHRKLHHARKTAHRHHPRKVCVIGVYNKIAIARHGANQVMELALDCSQVGENIGVIKL